MNGRKRPGHGGWSRRAGLSNAAQGTGATGRGLKPASSVVISRESESLYLLYKGRIHDPPSLYWKEHKLNDTLYGSTGDLAASP